MTWRGTTASRPSGNGANSFGFVQTLHERSAVFFDVMGRGRWWTHLGSNQGPAD